MQVTLLEEIRKANYFIRTFSLTWTGSTDKRIVKQFQYTSWPIGGNPSPSACLEFLNDIEENYTQIEGPTVVHCRYTLYSECIL